MKSGYHPSHDEQGQTLKEQGWYHTPAWRRARLLALQRDHYLCQECLRQGKVTHATEVHHIKPLKDYPELGLEVSNLESLCWQCHEGTKVKIKTINAPPSVKILCVRDGSETEDWKNI